MKSKTLSKLFLMIGLIIGLCGCEKEIPVASVKLNQQNLNLVKGEEFQLTATVNPEDATYEKVLWTSSDETIATVDQSGKVKAIEKGSCLIHAKAGDISEACEVIVSGIQVEKITLNKNELELIIGESVQLTATITPENAENKKIDWFSSNEEVALIDEDGMIMALSLGNSSITAKVGNVEATCEVKVKGIEVESIVLSQNEANLTIGDILMLTATVNPDNATDKTIAWSCDNEKVAIVDAIGTVTAKGAGTAIITAKAGDKTATCTVNVIAGSPHIGDYYYSDNTFTTELDPSKTVIGIVFYVNPDGVGGMIVGLDEYEKAPWGAADEETGANDHVDGMVNMEKIKRTYEWETNHPQFKWAADKTEGGLSWYIPATQEARQLYAGMCNLVWIAGWGAEEGEISDWGVGEKMPGYEDEIYIAARAAFNERLTAANGTVIQSSYYMTSTEDSKLAYFYAEMKKGLTQNTKKSYGKPARAIAKF